MLTGELPWVGLVANHQEHHQVRADQFKVLLLIINETLPVTGQCLPDNDS